LTAVAVYVVPVRSVGAIARCIGCEPPPRVTLLAGFEHVRTGSVVTGSRRRAAHISRVWLSRVGARLAAVAVYVVGVRSVGAIARCIGCEPPPRATLLASFEHVRRRCVVTWSTRRQHGWLRAREGDTGRENGKTLAQFDVLAVGEANARQAGASIERIDADGSDGVGDGDARQAGVCERPDADGSDGVGDGDARQAGATIERSGADGSDGVGDGDDLGSAPDLNPVTSVGSV